MGRRGPKPEPTALKLLRGNPGKRAINKAEPKLPAITDPPKGLTKRAKAEWQRLAGELSTAGVLTIGDVAAFRTYCELVAEVEAYERLIKRVGRESAHSLGYANYIVKLRLQQKQYAETLGLTPSSRGGVKRTGGATSGDPDADFLFKKGSA